MDEGGWYFPPSYEHWIQNSTIPSNKSSLIGLELEMESAKLSEELLVSGPLEHDESTQLPIQDTKQLSPPSPPLKISEKKKPKKKRRNFHEATFDEKYDLTTQVLGRGAHSLVALGIEKETGKQFAVKVIEKYEGYDRCSVLREIDLLHFLVDCPNVLHLHDSFEEVNEFYLVFERMEGGPLLGNLQSMTKFTEKEASHVVHDIAIALKFLHDKGISHRDLKPDNILCCRKDSVNPVVICDFNLASGISGIGSATTPDLYTPVGSAEFMAPEVVDAFVGDAPAYDKRCDLWSLGVILYIMLCGKPPFTGNCNTDCDWEKGGSCRQCQSILWHNILDANYEYSEEDGWDTVSDEGKDLVSHLLVKDAAKRYTVEEVLCHPWFSKARDTLLSTPRVLKRESSHNHLSQFTSEAVAYSRIISERQTSQDATGVTLRWSTPPKFGLSPPGKSRLAKRRSLKQGLKFGSQLSLNGGDSPRTPSPRSPSSPIKFSSSLSPEYDLRCASMDANWSNARNITPIHSPIIDEVAAPEAGGTPGRKDNKGRLKGENRRQRTGTVIEVLPPSFSDSDSLSDSSSSTAAANSNSQFHLELTTCEDEQAEGNNAAGVTSPFCESDGQTPMNESVDFDTFRNAAQQQKAMNVSSASLNTSLDASLSLNESLQHDTSYSSLQHDSYSELDITPSTAAILNAMGNTQVTPTTGSQKQPVESNDEVTPVHTPRSSEYYDEDDECYGEGPIDYSY